MKKYKISRSTILQPILFDYSSSPGETRRFQDSLDPSFLEGVSAHAPKQGNTPRLAAKRYSVTTSLVG